MVGRIDRPMFSFERVGESGRKQEKAVFSVMYEFVQLSAEPKRIQCVMQVAIVNDWYMNVLEETKMDDDELPRVDASLSNLKI